MNQVKIGSFIAQKRKEKNWTQAQLAEQIGVSNKTVSKWETGKCMPDYSIVQLLCNKLNITVLELMNGEENTTQAVADTQSLELLKRTQQLEWHNKALSGFILMIMGIVLQCLHYNFGGSDVKDFISGALLGISVPMMIVGLYITTRYSVQQFKANEKKNGDKKE